MCMTAVQGMMKESYVIIFLDTKGEGVGARGGGGGGNHLSG